MVLDYVHVCACVLMVALHGLHTVCISQPCESQWVLSLSVMDQLNITCYATVLTECHIHATLKYRLPSGPYTECQWGGGGGEGCP